jgi:hypothetical protein
MFDPDLPGARKHRTTTTFWAFVDATRTAVARIPADRPRD